MKRFALLLFVLPAMLYGQGVRYDGTVTAPASNVPAGASAPLYSVPNALIKVCGNPAAGTPCTNTVTVYSDQALTHALTQPITSNLNGAFGFYVAPGTYNYSVQSRTGQYLATYPLTLGVSGIASTSALLKGNGTGSAVSATGADVTGLLSALTGCTTPGYVFSPQSGTCIAAGVAIPGTVKQVLTSNGAGGTNAAPTTIDSTTGAIVTPAGLTSGAQILNGTDASCANIYNFFQYGSSDDCDSRTETFTLSNKSGYRNSNGQNYSYSFYGPGVNLGNIGGWSVNKALLFDNNSYRAGITQNINHTLHCYKTGDCIGYYGYIWGTGGSADQSGEGIKLIASNGGELSDNGGPTSTISALNGVGEINRLTNGSGQTPGIYSVAATGGGGSGAVATIVVDSSGAVLQDPTITATGHDYTSFPTFTLAAGGTPATFTGTLGNPVLGTISGSISDGNQLIDLTAATITGNLNGASSAFTIPSGAQQWLNKLPVTGVTLPINSSWCYATSGSSNSLTIPKPGISQDHTVSVTFTCTAGLISAAYPAMTTGPVYASGYNYSENATITAVGTQSGTTPPTQSVTVRLRYPNQSISLWQGGLQQHEIEFGADYRHSGLRTTYPAVGSVDGTNLIYNLMFQGGQSVFTLPASVGVVTSTGTNSDFTLRYGAQVVMDSGAGTGPILEPNTVPWTAGDSVQEPHYFAVQTSGITMQVQQNSPCVSGCDGIKLNYVGSGISNNMNFLDFSSSQPVSDYTTWGVKGATILKFSGPFQAGIHMINGPEPGGYLMGFDTPFNNDATVDTKFLFGNGFALNGVASATSIPGTTTGKEWYLQGALRTHVDGALYTSGITNGEGNVTFDGNGSIIYTGQYTSTHCIFCPTDTGATAYAGLGYSSLQLSVVVREGGNSSFAGYLNQDPNVSGAATNSRFMFDAFGLAMPQNAVYGWTSQGSGAGTAGNANAYDTQLWRSAAGVVSFGTTAQNALGTIKLAGITSTGGYTQTGTTANVFTGVISVPNILPTLYSAAGTALPACAVGIKGTLAVVSDATVPTYMGAYTSGGTTTAAVICSYNGTTYSWLTH